MNETIVESIPTIWVEERDVPFFRATDGVFSPAFLAGASAMLSLNDDSLIPVG